MKEQTYVIFGATENTISRVWPYIENKNLTENILYFCDNNIVLHNTTLNGYTIFSIDKLRENPDAIVIIAAMKVKGIVESMRMANVHNKVVTYPWFRFSFVDRVLNKENIVLNSEYITNNSKEILDLYNLEDEYTSGLLNRIFEHRKMKEFEFVDIETIKQFESVHDYFYDDKLEPKGDVTFVDIGAYDGDSIISTYKRYGSRIKKIYAFEPEKDNFDVLISTIDKAGLKNITNALMYGISDKVEEGYLSEETIDTMSSKISSDKTNIKIDLKTIDSLDIDVKGNLLIKMDIEGYELNALIGAKSTIQRYTPYLAICLYHKMEDILEIPKYILSINPNYNIYLRAGGHLECYAVPK